MTDPPTTHEETLDFVRFLGSVILSSSFSHTVSDLDTLLSLLRHIIDLPTLLPLDEGTLGTLTLVIDLQASPDVADILQSTGENRASEVLAVVEKMGRLAAESVEGRVEIERDNIDLMVVREGEFERVDYEVESNGVHESSVSVSEDVVPTTGRN